MRLTEDFNTLPSLKFISATRIVTNVWNRRDVTTLIDECFNSYNDDLYSISWSRIEYRVNEFIQRIEGVPLDLLEKMKLLSRLIGKKISSFRLFASFTPDLIYFRLEFPITYWTAYGTVDVKRHEELLARSNRIATDLRYILACNDCFQEIVEELFNLLTPQQKNSFQTYDSSRELLSYWTRRTSNDLSTYQNLISRNIYVIRHHYSAHQFAFLYTLLTGNKSGIEYFLNFLSRDIWEIVAENHAHFIAEQYENRTIRQFPINKRQNDLFVDAIYFLLSKLNEHRRMQFLQKSPYKFLCMFLRYPFFGIFSTYVNLLIDDLEWQHIRLLLNSIFALERLQIFLFGLHLFDDLWRICPQAAKTDIRTNTENEVLQGEMDFLELLERINRAA
ncbi:hypothetical protein TNCV_4915501 [Trichonephila clavipes]|nr:hypothetical protein TNCV_4915501 [Trichonephila clavipes]